MSRFPPTASSPGCLFILRSELVLGSAYFLASVTGAPHGERIPSKPGLLLGKLQGQCYRVSFEYTQLPRAEPSVPGLRRPEPGHWPSGDRAGRDLWVPGLNGQIFTESYAVQLHASSLPSLL